MPDELRLSRRRLLQLGLALPLPMVLAACDGSADQPGQAAPDTTEPPASAWS